MLDVIEAVYENGVFRPAEPVTLLSPGQRVWISLDQPPERRSSPRKEADLIRRLEAQGLVEKPNVPPEPQGFQPLQIPGPGLSETILAERR
jgi:predicted DNA-binding antitoxin AbrB/MazE fold protein